MGERQAQAGGMKAAQSLEHGCSIEKASGTAGASVSISRENERKLLEGQSARRPRLARFGAKFIAIGSPKRKSPD
jgi:hypothetical protein